jgi:hypothetical protein
MDTIQKLLAVLASTPPDASPKIVCFYTGPQMPPNCEPMSRNPAPPLDVRLDEGLVRIVRRATAKNRSLHDGALMIGRNNADAEYVVTGWSFRLFPPPHSGSTRPNRGAAFNSCLAMSNVHSVDCLYLVSPDGIFRFKAGRFRMVRSAK